MKVTYDTRDEDSPRAGTVVRFTTWLSASSCSPPVLVLPDGVVVDQASWPLLNYTVEECTEEETEQLKNWLKIPPGTLR